MRWTVWDGKTGRFISRISNGARIGAISCGIAAGPTVSVVGNTTSAQAWGPGGSRSKTPIKTIQSSRTCQLERCSAILAAVIGFEEDPCHQGNLPCVEDTFCRLLLRARSALRSLRTPRLPKKKRRAFESAVCDWMILKRQKLSAFALAEAIGADGLEVDMGSLGSRETFDSKLADRATREDFLQESSSRGVAICSLAMSGFYAQSFAGRPDGA